MIRNTQIFNSSMEETSMWELAPHCQYIYIYIYEEYIMLIGNEF
jgi:hypothetical protein